tara:strand:- start:415 stop:1110 length:696 start_codon:yes stop_codon:yes gene_type:complete
MAINVNDVYKSVLVVLEQQKRGVITPNEFNRIAAQSQLEIYNQYFDDLNQLLGMPQTSLAYADRMALLDEKISLFKTTSAAIAESGGFYTVPDDVHELGSVIYDDTREVQRIQQYEVFTTNASPLTAPTAHYPVYTYESKKLKLFPDTLNLAVKINYLKSPAKPKWVFNIDKELGHYMYNSIGSVDFEIHSSDQSLLIDKILSYAGVMTKDQFAMSLANNKEQQINVNDQK